MSLTDALFLYKVRGVPFLAVTAVTAVTKLKFEANFQKKCNRFSKNVTAFLTKTKAQARNFEKMALERLQRLQSGYILSVEREISGYKAVTKFEANNNNNKENQSQLINSVTAVTAFSGVWSPLFYGVLSK